MAFRNVKFRVQAFLSLSETVSISEIYGCPSPEPVSLFFFLVSLQKKEK